MAAERLGVVQFRDLAQHCTDPQLRELCLQIANQNLQHFGRLMSILNQSEGGQGTYQVGTNQVPQTNESTFSGTGFTGSGQTNGGFSQ